MPNDQLTWAVVSCVVLEMVFAVVLLRHEWSLVNATPSFYEPYYIVSAAWFAQFSRLTGVIAWCWWYLRVTSTLAKDGKTWLRVATPGSVFWWFVPGFNLAMPYVAIREIWTTFVERSVAGERRRVFESVLLLVW